MKVVIVIPTYNEKANIARLVDKLMAEFEDIERLSAFQMQILVVDDNSPDCTGQIVKSIAENNNKVHLITGQKKGLGRAYIRGFRYAIDHLKDTNLNKVSTY